MLLIDLEQGKIVSDEELKEKWHRPNLMPNG